MGRQAILRNHEQGAYYQTMQTHISELMVASLGIGSGYIDVNNSKGSKAVNWICRAISSAFPGASVATTIAGSGITYLHIGVYLRKPYTIGGGVKLRLVIIEKEALVSIINAAESIFNDCC